MTVDVSFNNLTGTIPNSIRNCTSLRNLYVNYYYLINYDLNFF